MKVALVHDWLTTIGGAEKVLESLMQIFPSSLYALITNPKQLKNTPFEGLKIETSFIQKLPYAKRHYRFYLPLFPIAIEQFNLSDYDLIVSSSHAVAKGVITHAEQMHICYCHTPMRYAWDLYHQYLRDIKLQWGLKGIIAKAFLHYLRIWDVHSSSRVNLYVANSRYVARRIGKFYQREAHVLYPPVDVDFFSLEERKENFYVTASRFVPYKKMALIVEAFGEMPEKTLIVIGDGPERKNVERKKKKNIQILGYQSDLVLRAYLQKAKGFVFAALEDFGILPVEAQACGTPVIALGKGGTLETVLKNRSGVFFYEQTVQAIIEAIKKFETMKFNPLCIREHAQTFCKERFKKRFLELVHKTYKEFVEMK